jgi:hypothetical protein
LKGDSGGKSWGFGKEIPNEVWENFEWNFGRTFKGKFENGFGWGLR